MFVEVTTNSPWNMRQALNHLHLPLARKEKTDSSKNSVLRSVERNIDFQLGKPCVDMGSGLRTGGSFSLAA
jgi:hypothetical protein